MCDSVVPYFPPANSDPRKLISASLCGIFLKTEFKDQRCMAMELCCRYSNYKQKEIGVMFGVDCSTVSQNRQRLKTKLKTHRKLKKQYDRILKQIEKLSNSKI
jgi:hypothetical protein